MYICIYIYILVYIHRRTRAVRIGGRAAAPDRCLRAAGGRIQGNSRVWCQVRQGAPACPYPLQRPKSLRCPSRLILVHSRELPLLMQQKASSLWHQKEIPFLMRQRELPLLMRKRELPLLMRQRELPLFLFLCVCFYFSRREKGQWS